MTNMVLKTVYIPKDMLARVKAIQEETGSGFAEMVRRALESHLTKLEGQRNVEASNE